MKFVKEQTDRLRELIASDSALSDKRRTHILAVERMAVRLGALYAPGKTDILAVAALLHDITKEYPTERQIAVCREHGHEPTETELYAPKTFHARTAAYLIPELYPEYADAEVVSAVRWHTTGHAGMTLTEKLVYLADYIDDSRKFDDCVKLRHAFFDACPEKMDMNERFRHLREILIMSYDMTVAALLEGSKPISPDTVDALNELLCEKCDYLKKQYE